MISISLKLEKIDNGVLRISLPKTNDEKVDKEIKEEILELLEKNGSDDTFWELTEHYWTNGWGVCMADDLGQMSECLVVAEEMYHEDDGSLTLNGRVWSNIHNYQIACPIKTILSDGYVDFYIWDTFDNENFKL